MGHVQPGGEATGSPATVGEAIWPIWRRYKRLFRTWTMQIDMWLTPGSWGWFGNDVVSAFRKNPSTKRAFALLGDVSPEVFNAISALATLNQRRQELGFQMLALFYVTVPLTLFVSAGEIFPEAFRDFMTKEGDTTIRLLGFLIGFTLLYLASLWRARQMVHVLDLIRIERGLDPVSTVELRDQG